VTASEGKGSTLTGLLLSGTARAAAATAAPSAPSASGPGSDIQGARNIQVSIMMFKSAWA
jgi:hypothetical protein